MGSARRRPLCSGQRGLESQISSTRLNIRWLRKLWHYGAGHVRNATCRAHKKTDALLNPVDKAAERTEDYTKRHDDSDELLKPGQRQRTADLDMPSIPEPEALEVGT
jgi:hypothetical protein